MNKDMGDLGNDLERAMNEVGTDRDYLNSSKAK